MDTRLCVFEFTKGSSLCVYICYQSLEIIITDIADSQAEQSPALVTVGVVSGVAATIVILTIGIVICNWIAHSRKKSYL